MLHEQTFDSVRSYAEHIAAQPALTNPLDDIENYDVVSVEPRFGLSKNTVATYVNKTTNKQSQVAYDRVDLNEFVKSHSIENKLTENEKRLEILHPTKSVLDKQVLRDLGLVDLQENDVEIVKRILNNVDYPIFRNCFKSGVKVIGNTGTVIPSDGIERNGFEVVEELDGGNTVKLDIPLTDYRSYQVRGDLLFGVKDTLVGLSHNLFHVDKKRHGVTVVRVGSLRVMTCKTSDGRSLKISMKWVTEGLEVTIKHVQEVKKVIPMSRPTTPIPFRTQVYSHSSNLSAIAIGYQFDRLVTTVKTNLKDLTLPKTIQTKLINSKMNQDIFYIDLSGKEMSAFQVKNRRDLTYVERDFILCEKKDVQQCINSVLDGFKYNGVHLRVNQTKGITSLTVTEKDNSKTIDALIKHYYVTFDIARKRGSLILSPDYKPLEETLDVLDENHFEFNIDEEYEQPVLLIREVTKTQHNVPSFSFNEVLAETVPVKLNKNINEVFTVKAVSDENQYLFGNVKENIVVVNNINYNTVFNGDKIIVDTVFQNNLYGYYGYQIPILKGSLITISNCFNEIPDATAVFGFSKQPLAVSDVADPTNKFYSLKKVNEVYYNKDMEVIQSFDSIRLSFNDELIVELLKDGSVVDGLTFKQDVKETVIYLSNIVIPNKESVETLFKNCTLIKA